MKFGLDNTTLEKLSKVFETNPKVNKALIFGSRAKGNYRDDSDIDIALKGYDITLNDVLQLNVALEEEGISYKVDLVNYGTVKAQALVEHIDRVGIEVYTRWKEYQLGDFVEIQTGPFGSLLHAADYVSVGTPSIMPTNIGSRLNIVTDNIAFVGPKDIARLKNYTVKKGDIIYSRRGDVEKCALITNKQEGWLCGTGCLRIRIVSKDLSAKFCAYYLSAPEIKSWILNSTVGTTMPNLNTSILKHLPIVVPPVAEQLIIAATLQNLDDKIDLLHRQNKTLEALAGALFRDWFVLNAEEHWEEGTLQDYIYLDPREQKAKGEQLFFDMKCLSNNSLAMAEGIYRDVSSATSFRNSDTLLAKITPCLENGKTAFVMNLQDDEVARGSTEFIVMRSKGMVSPYWIYCLARDEDFREKAIQSMTGTSGRQRVQTDLLKNIDVKMSEARMEEFHATVLPYFQKIKANGKQIGLLNKLRDTLLPKLMSGEIRALTQAQKVTQSA